MVYHTYYRWARYRPTAAFVGHQGRPAPPVNLEGSGGGGPPRPPPSSLRLLQRRMRRRLQTKAAVITNQVRPRVIMLTFSTLTSRPFNYASTAQFAVIYVYSIEKLIRKNADRLQTAMYSNYPSPRSCFPSGEQSLLTLSYKIAFCWRLRRY